MALATVQFRGATHVIEPGRLQVLPLADGEREPIEIRPARGFDVGAGRGRPHAATARGGVVGLILDGRGRPIHLPADDAARVARLREWLAIFTLRVES